VTGERILIMGGTDRVVVDFARRQLGITHADQIVSVTQPYQMRGYRGQRLIVLEDCYTRVPRWYELIAYAREAGLEIDYRNCGGGH